MRIPVRGLRRASPTKAVIRAERLVVVDVNLAVGPVRVLTSRDILRDRAHERVAALPEHRLHNLGVNAVPDNREDRVAEIRGLAFDDGEFP